MDTQPTPKHPRWIVIYYIHTPGSTWLGKGVEFFDDEEPARKRGAETNGTSRPFYPPHDRQYLGAAQGHAPPVSLTDYLQECDEAKHAAIVDRAVALVRRPVRLHGTTLEVFDVDAEEQLPALKKLHEMLYEGWKISGSRMTIIFHTRAESRRLHADFVNNFPHQCDYSVEVNFDGKRKFFCDLCGGAFR